VGGDYNEPSTFLSLLTSTHSGNISRFNDPAYDKILAQAAVENSAKARNDDYNAAEDHYGQSADRADLPVH
jgi:oligopeptide transport system substrate-binding protein